MVILFAMLMLLFVSSTISPTRFRAAVLAAQLAVLGAFIGFVFIMDAPFIGENRVAAGAIAQVSQAMENRERQAFALLPLDQLDLVAVGILDEGDNGGAELHRSGRARDLAAGFGDLFAQAIDVRHADREMAEAAAQIVGLLLVPVVGQLDSAVLASSP